MLVRREDTAGVKPSLGGAAFGPVVKALWMFRGFDQITPVGRFNNDSRNDLIGRYAPTGRYFLFRGDGAGGFSRVRLDPASSGAPTGALALIGPGDVTGDGHADLVARFSGGVLKIYPGDGHGAFALARTVPGTWSAAVIVGYGDYNGDGRNDLFQLTSNRTGYIALGDGLGGFARRLGPLTGDFGQLARISGAQLSGGPESDLVGFSGERLVAVPNLGVAVRMAPIDTGATLGDTNLVLNVGDWDRDGHGDVVTRVASTGGLLLRRGDGAGHLAAPTVLSTGNFNKVAMLAAVGDTTGDGWPDLMGQPSGGSMMIYPGRGPLGMGRAYVSHSALTASGQIGLGRWDADGAPDNAFRVSGQLRWMKGNGPGGLFGGTGALLDIAAYNWVLSPGDVNRDGRPDLVVRLRSDGSLMLVPGAASGFGAPRALAPGFSGYDLAG